MTEVQSVRGVVGRRVARCNNDSGILLSILRAVQDEGASLSRDAVTVPRGVGIIKAPRGTLIHHYRVNDDGLIVRATLIVSTTHNNQAMNEAVRAVPARDLDGRELTEPLLNHIEVAIRACDPCLSCATHALGRMPLEVDLVDGAGATVDRLVRDADGRVQREVE